jgi:hypothetical protein
MEVNMLPTLEKEIEEKCFSYVFPNIVTMNGISKIVIVLPSREQINFAIAFEYLEKSEYHKYADRIRCRLRSNILPDKDLDMDLDFIQYEVLKLTNKDFKPYFELIKYGELFSDLEIIKKVKAYIDEFTFNQSTTNLMHLTTIYELLNFERKLMKHYNLSHRSEPSYF